MIKRLIHCTGLLIALLVLGVTAARAQVTDSQAGNARETVRSEFQLSTLLAQARRRPRLGFSLMPPGILSSTGASSFSIAPMAAGPNLQVLGGGTVGRLTKWTGFTSSNSFIGDSSIFEDKYGNITIGTGTSTVTVAGTIQASGGTTVAHDSTLQGDGTSGFPLGVALPLILTGSGGASGVIQATNQTIGGSGLLGIGGNSSNTSPAGHGLVGFGGNGDNAPGGLGLEAEGGASTNNDGGPGVFADGGFSTVSSGGSGIISVGGGGSGAGHTAGHGIEATGGVGSNGATKGLAGKFNGDVTVTGNLSKGGGAFKIDHPLDPENKYLYHSFVESPDMMNIYNGNVTTDENGEAAVTLPDWFETLNRDFRYQLTVIGTFAQAIVAEKVKGNRFKIRTNAPGVEVSWQVTGIRQDAYANAHRIPVEEDKSARERGYYLHPDAFNQPEERGTQWADHPEMMQRLKQRRLEAERKQ